MPSSVRLLSVLLASLLCVLVLPTLVEAGDDYYKILGIERSSNEKQITKAYRKLSMLYHPDKNPNEIDKYHTIVGAYEVLSDPEKRRVYDQYGEEGLKQYSGNGGGGGGGSPFDMFFGGGRHRGGGGASNMPKGADVVIPLEVSLQDLYEGAVFKVRHRKQVLCTHCRGTGTDKPEDLKTCPTCKGKGHRIVRQQMGPGFTMQSQVTCDACNGKGKIASSKCHHCGGTKVESGDDYVVVHVEKGMIDDQVIEFEQEADQHPGEIPGDLQFKVRTAAHAKFVRKGDNLHYQSSISLLEALVGFEKTFKHLDGHEVKIERTQVTIPGFTLEIKEEGMPMHEFPSQKGDLYVTFTIRFPIAVTAEQAVGFKQLLKS
eukprot:TRINITY_DN432_c5_g1_i2.p1 TRINITY_DN432_c5_g1~~TRINITY_DN432_c5_g1_i2.p1  ORF type:complete len:373 (+),score=110.14 TRINITY_DN432_c5_g1_i2:158-1276(+)